MVQQFLTGGDGTSGQTGLESRDVINENFTEVYTQGILQNSSNVLYLRGDENTDGSLRFRANGTVQDGVFEERESGVWNPASMEFGADSLYLGVNVGVSAVGDHLAVEASAEPGTRRLVAHNIYDEETTIQRARIVNATQYLVDFPANTPGAGVFTGTTFGFAIVATLNGLYKDISYFTDATAATSEVTLRVYKGTDNTGDLIFSRAYPAATFAANQRARLEAVGWVEFNTGEDYFTEISSANDFSIQLDSTGTEPYYEVTVSVFQYNDVWEVDDYDVRADGVYSFTAGEDFTVQDGKPYVCNTTGTQTGTFASNIALWDLLGAAGSGSGDVTGPGSSVDGSLSTWNGTDGDALNSVANATLVDDGADLELVLNSPSATGSVSIRLDDSSDSAFVNFVYNENTGVTQGLLGDIIFASGGGDDSLRSANGEISFQDNFTFNSNSDNAFFTMQTGAATGSASAIWNDSAGDEYFSIVYDETNNRIDAVSTAATFEIRQAINGGSFALRTETEPLNVVFDGLSVNPFMQIDGTSGSHTSSWYLGSSSPEGLVTADQGSIYFRTTGSDDNNALWIKQTGIGNTGWEEIGGGGSGDVVGPASATDNALVRFDGTTGKLIKDSANLVFTDDGTDADLYVDAPSATGTAEISLRDNGDVLKGGLLYSEIGDAFSLFATSILTMSSEHYKLLDDGDIQTLILTTPNTGGETAQVFQNSLGTGQLTLAHDEANTLTYVHISDDSGTVKIETDYDDTTGVARSRVNDLLLTSTDAASDQQIIASGNLDIISNTGDINLNPDPSGSNIQVTIEPEAGAGTSNATLRVVDAGATNGLSLYHDGTLDDNFIDSFGAGDFHIRQTNSSNALRIRSAGGNQMFISSGSAGLSELMTWDVEGANGAEIPIFLFSANPEGNVTAPVGSVNFSDGNSGDAGVYFKATGAGNTGWVSLIGSGSGDVTGPGSSVDSAIATWNGTDGDLLNSVASITAGSDGTNTTMTATVPTTNGTAGFVLVDSTATTQASFGYVESLGTGNIGLVDMDIRSNVSGSDIVVATGALDIDVAGGSTNFINLQGSTVRVNLLNPLDTSTVELGLQNSAGGDEFVFAHDEVNDLSTITTDGPLRTVSGGTMQFENVDTTNDISFNNAIFFGTDSDTAQYIDIYEPNADDLVGVRLFDNVGTLHSSWLYNGSTNIVTLASFNSNSLSFNSTAAIVGVATTAVNFSGGTMTLEATTSAVLETSGAGDVSILTQDNDQAVTIQDFASFTRPAGTGAILAMQAQNASSSVEYRIEASGGATAADWVMDDFADTVDFTSYGGRTLAVRSANELDLFSGNSVGGEAIRFGHTSLVSAMYLETATPAGSISGDPGDMTVRLDGNDSSVYVNIGASDGNTQWKDIGAGTVLIWGDGSVASTITERYLTPGYDQGQAPTTRVNIIAPRDGYLRNMYVHHNEPGTSTEDIVYLLEVNSAATAIGVTVAADESDGSQTTSLVPVSAGDEITIAVTKPVVVADPPINITATVEFI